MANRIFIFKVQLVYAEISNALTAVTGGSRFIYFRIKMKIGTQYQIISENQ